MKLTPKMKDCMMERMIDAGIDVKHLNEKFPDDNYDYDAFVRDTEYRRLGWEKEKRVIALQTKVVERHKQIMENVYNGTPDEFMTAVTGSKSYNPVAAPEISMESKILGLRADSEHLMHTLIENFRSKRFGLRNPREMADPFIDGFYGVKSGNTIASTMVQEFMTARNRNRVRLNKAGGSVADITDPPTRNNRDRIMKVSFDEWAKDVIDTIDWNRAQMSMELKDLRVEYDRLIGKKDTAKLPGQKETPLYKKLTADEKYVFKDGASYRKYNQKYGEPDIFTTIVDYLQEQHINIAAMETFGPDPDRGFTQLQKHARNLTNNKRVDDITTTGKTDLKSNTGLVSQRVYNHLLGKVGVADGSFAGKMAKTGAVSRSAITGSMAGGIFPSQFSDLMTTAARMQYNGVPLQKRLKISLRQAKNIITRAEKSQAMRLGAFVESWTGEVDRIQGGANEDNLIKDVWRGFARKYFSQFPYKISGVEHFTEMTRFIAYLGILEHMTDHSTKGFAEIKNIRFIRMLEHNGIDGDMWDVIRMYKTTDAKGVEMIDPILIPDDKIRSAALGMLNAESRNHVGQPTAREASWFREDPAGTLKGESMRSGGVFTSFSMWMWNTILAPAHHKNRIKMDLRSGEMGDMAQFYIRATIIAPLFGYATIAARSILKGEEPPDPRDMSNTQRAAFYAKCAAQGGLFGIAFDVVKGVFGQFNETIMDSLGGPVAGTIDETAGIIKGVVSLAIDPDEEKARQTARRAFDLGLKMLVHTTNVWYMKSALEKIPGTDIGINAVRQKIDPTYLDKKQASRERRIDRGEGGEPLTSYDTLE